jgi:hypothetical protein
MSIKYNDTEFKVGEPYPVHFRPINSGKLMPDWCGMFAIELKSLNYEGKDRLIIDYNHDTEQVIGYIDTNTFKVDANGWSGDGFLVSLIDGDKASEIIKLGKAGVPFEVSPTLDINEDDVEKVKAGDTVTVNEQAQDGPFRIYKNVVVRGISICPYGRDNDTNTILGMNFRNSKKKGKLDMSTKIKLSDEDKEKNEELSEGDDENKETVKDETLAKFTKRFGAEKGVALYQSGADYDKVEETIATLTKAGISRVPNSADDEDKETLNDDEEKKELNNDGNEDETDPEPTPDDKKPDDLKKLQAQIKQLTAQVTRLSKQRGEDKPVTLSKENPKSGSFTSQILARLPK